MSDPFGVSNAFLHQMNTITTAAGSSPGVMPFNEGYQNVNVSYVVGDVANNISSTGAPLLEDLIGAEQDTHEEDKSEEDGESRVKPCSVKLARLTKAEIKASSPKPGKKHHHNDNNNNVNTNEQQRKLIDDSFLMPPPPISLTNGATRQRSGGGKNICLFCAKTFSQSKLLESHMNVHTRERPFECPHCDESFSFPAVLWVHERRHLGHSYICKFCNKAYTAPTNLSAHIKAHHQNQVPPPPLPPPVSSKKKAPQRSKADVNGKPPPKKKRKLDSGSPSTISAGASKSSSPTKQPTKTFTCSSCPQTFTTKRRLKLHITMEHAAAAAAGGGGGAPSTPQPTPPHPSRMFPTAPDVFRCEQCAQEFSSDGEMKRHMCTYNNDESRPQLWQNYSVNPVEAPDVRYHTMMNPMECYFTAEDRQFYDMICNM